MIPAQHNKFLQGINSFHPQEELGEVISKIYQKVRGYHLNCRNSDLDVDTSFNFPIDDTLEIIDGIRSPLAEKRLEGQPLSESDLKRLEMLDSLTDEILSLVMQEPKESIEVRLALDHAKRVTRKK